MPPKVSVVMSVFNAGAFLREAVESVLAQTFTDFEFLIIDDGSTDDSLPTLRLITDPRLKIIPQENRGLIASLNRGIQTAQGEYIARMDADDRCLPDRLAIQVKYLDEHPQIALLGGSITTMDEEGNILAPRVGFPRTHEEIWAGIGRKPWVFCHPAVMFQRQAAIDVGMYRSEFAHAEDAEFFARLMTKYQAANLPDVLLAYRLRRSAVSFTRTAHGQINARLVATMIDHWKPGEPFEPTPQQRQEADNAIAQCGKPVSKNRTESAYHCRIGREHLRARQWRKAITHYATAAKSDWQNKMAYLGLASAVLHHGGEPRVNQPA